jgi:hypothetical protein
VLLRQKRLDANDLESIFTDYETRFRKRIALNG